MTSLKIKEDHLNYPNEDDPKFEDKLKNEDDLKNKDGSKYEDNLKRKFGLFDKRGKGVIFIFIPNLNVDIKSFS